MTTQFCSWPGGNSDNVTWNISLDFSALGVDQIRQAWLTFAPQLIPGSPYQDAEWSATFTNWSVADPNGVQRLQCAGPGSVRVGNGDPSCVYTGAGWSTLSANNYWHGFGRMTSNPGDRVQVTYSCTNTHDLYLGTSLYNNRGVVSVSLEVDTASSVDCFVNVSSEIVTRRIIRKAVSAGTHTVTITLESNNHQATDPKWDINSLGYYFLFDYIEAALPSDLPDPAVSYSNVSPALDFDTDATYKVSPQRLLWHLQKLGFGGQLNEYIGVYWWNERRRQGGEWNSAVIDIAGGWAPGDSATITIGASSTSTGLSLRKAVTQWDTVDTIAAHFVYYLNAASVSMYARKTGTGQLTISTRTPNWGDSLSVNATPASGTITVTGNLNVGTDGTWVIDPPMQVRLTIRCANGMPICSKP